MNIGTMIKPLDDYWMIWMINIRSLGVCLESWDSVEACCNSSRSMSSFSDRDELMTIFQGQTWKSCPKNLGIKNWLVVWNMIFFHNIWDNPSHWLIFFRGVETTNQKILGKMLDLWKNIGTSEDSKGFFQPFSKTVTPLNPNAADDDSQKIRWWFGHRSPRRSGCVHTEGFELVGVKAGAYIHTYTHTHIHTST